MPIAEMKKIYILAHRGERNAVISLLHRQGTVQLISVADDLSRGELPVGLLPEQADEAVPDLEAGLGEVRYCLDFLQRYFPLRKNFVEQFIGSRHLLTSERFNSYAADKDQIKTIYASCRAIELKLARLRNEETRCLNLAEELRPWAGFELPLEEVRPSERLRMCLGMVPAGALDRLQGEWSNTVPDGLLNVIFEDKEQIYVFLLYLEADEAGAGELLRKASFSLFDCGSLEGTAQWNLKELALKQEEIGQQKAAALDEMEKILEHRPRLMAYYDWHENRRARGEALSNLGRTEASILLQGWVPAAALPALEEALSRETETAVLAGREPEEGEDYPILLDNRSLVKPYEVITRLYSLPSKGEPDPTPLLAPFFFIFFGICLSDIGYGLLLSLLALFLARKLKLAGMGKQLVLLLFWGGLSAAFFGALMGGFFGNLIDLRPLWFNPLDDPMRMLVYCFVLGLFQVYCGMAVQAYREIKAGRIWAAVFDQGLWFLFLTGLALLALPGARQVATWSALSGAAGLVLTQGRSQKGLFKKFFGGLVSLYNITGYLSDVLSYSRLLALGLATGVIATAINTAGGLLAGSIAGVVVMVVLLLGGHIFNLLISTLGSFVHTSRLQYIEFFGKFFDGGGKPFRPFHEVNRFVDVEPAGHGKD